MLRSGSPPEAVFNLAVDGQIERCVSEPILAEFEEVLRRGRLAIDPDKVAVALARIREIATVVQPVARISAATDPDDNVFLECAEAAQAHYLVTGNTRHFRSAGVPRWSSRPGSFWRPALWRRTSPLKLQHTGLLRYLSYGNSEY